MRFSSKSLTFAAAIVLALVACFALSAPQQSEASPEGDAARTFVSNAIDTIHKYHVDGMNMERAELVAGAKNGAIRFIQAQENVAPEQRETVVSFLESHEFESISQLVHVLDRFGEEYADLDFTRLEHALVNGAILELDDPFTRLMTAEEMQKLQQQMQGGVDKTVGVSPQRGENGEIEVGHLRWNYWASITASSTAT